MADKATEHMRRAPLYTAPHTALDRVLKAARAIARFDPGTDGPVQRMELQAALYALETEAGNLATLDDVERAEDAHGCALQDGEAEVDRVGSALVSHGVNGMWVSGWLWVPGDETEDEES